jgi:hypothetical protein
MRRASFGDDVADAIDGGALSVQAARSNSFPDQRDRRVWRRQGFARACTGVSASHVSPK